MLDARCVHLPYVHDPTHFRVAHLDDFLDHMPVIVAYVAGVHLNMVVAGEGGQFHLQGP